jgi:hypothetical protein
MEYEKCMNKRKPDDECAHITLAMRPYYQTISEKKKLKYKTDPDFRLRELARRKAYYQRRKTESKEIPVNN